MNKVKLQEDHFEHWVVCKDGYVRGSKCREVIRYPIVSFEDLVYCPKCGRKIEGNVEHEPIH